MRTTIDLRSDLHRKALALARDTHRSLSDTVNDLLSRVLEPGSPPQLTRSAITGLPVVHLGHPVTMDDVRSLDDE